MDIFILDWVVYFAILFGFVTIKNRFIDVEDDIKGCFWWVLWIIFTIFYCVLFSFYNWSDFVVDINFNI